MKYVCLDTSHRNLVIALIEDDKIVAGCSMLSWKKQSETIFPKWMELMKQVNWQAKEIDGIVISDGPGSYTGVRIAMSVAKVFCTTRKIPLYTISTLQLYAGMSEDAYVMLDARSNRAYVGKLQYGELIEEPCILTLDEIREELKQKQVKVYGDSDLIGIETSEIDFVTNFSELKSKWVFVENPHTLTPRYLKDQSAYMVK